MWFNNILKKVQTFILKVNCLLENGKTVIWSDKYSTEIVLQGYNSSLTMLDSRNSGNNSNIVSENKSSLPNENISQENTDLDDEIPF